MTEVLCGRGAQCVGQLCVMGLSRREVRGSEIHLGELYVKALDAEELRVKIVKEVRVNE